MTRAAAAGLALACLVLGGRAQAQLPASSDSGETATAATAATGQRAAENALRQANDAFGTSIGREAIGLYDSDSVRGFSSTAAGNVRIDGLYFDQVWGLNSRLTTGCRHARDAHRIVGEGRDQAPMGLAARIAVRPVDMQSEMETLAITL
jgi:hypothetical protein